MAIVENGAGAINWAGTIFVLLGSIIAFHFGVWNPRRGYIISDHGKVHSW